jgi:3,4-dihydroxy 2-butanone 4-phosphate synthase/GTP cyclohydrolase II
MNLCVVKQEPQISISSSEEIIEEARNGRMFILVDDEDRENEGDLIVPCSNGHT